MIALLYEHLEVGVGLLGDTPENDGASKGEVPIWLLW